MKKMTCRDMGGDCDMEILANSPEEMMRKGEEHIATKHPELISKMENMTMEDNKKWNNNFMHKWDNDPDII